MAALKLKLAPALDELIDGQQVWRGQSARHGFHEDASTPLQPTGFAALDAVLPTGGWPDAAVTELLLSADGIGELQLLWPTLRRLTHAADAALRPVVLVAPPYVPYAPAWAKAQIDLGNLHVVHATADADALWAAEQCLRSGACSAVLCWGSLGTVKVRAMGVRRQRCALRCHCHRSRSRQGSTRTGRSASRRRCEHGNDR